MTQIDKEMDQPKIERVLRLMQLMSGTVNYSIGELADKLETSPRSIYRYIDTFRNAGFAVQKVHSDVYRIAQMSSKYPDLEKLVYFSEEEAYLVNSLIDRLDPTNTLKANLHRKLASIYESTTIGDYVDKKSNAANIEELSKAIKDRMSVMLRNYQSGSGNTRNRYVEPFAFTTNFIDVWAYDTMDKRNKVFKISRIEEVVIQDEFPWEYESEHQKQPTDVFRMSGQPLETIKLRMSTLAKNLLIEEYPLAEKDVKKWHQEWILTTEITNVMGAGRFVMGLPGDVVIISGDKLREYIKDRIAATYKDF